MRLGYSSVFRARAVVAVVTAVYVLTFYYAYRFFISPNYSYQGFTYQPYDIYVSLASYAFSVFPSFFLPSQLKKPSAFVVWMIYLLVYVPALLVMGYTLQQPVSELLYFYTALLISMLSLAAVPYFPAIPLPQFRIPRWVFWVVLGTYLIAMYGVLIKVFGVNGLVSIKDVYNVRLKARSTLASTGRWVGYQLRWISEAINPYLMAIGLSDKRPALFIVGAAGQVLIYSFDATKSTIGSIFLIVAVFYLISRSFKVQAPALVLSFVALLWSVAVVDGLLGVATLTGLLTRRFFAVPGLLTSMYYSYFSNHPYFHWAHTTFANLLGLSSSPYPEYKSPGFLIGDVFFRNPAGNANANLWADGYANAGVLGVLLVTLVFIVFLWLYDSVSLKKDIRVALLLIAMPTFAITNTSLLTSLLSHGWIPAILLMWYSGDRQRQRVATRIGQSGG